MALTFSIITPSFKQLDWLKLCAKSIEDQKADVELEHIIQDAGTGPELEEWITKNTSAKLFVEKDNGMYDAVNRGLRRSTGDILAYLNCDEQYLPGALQTVETFFQENPKADVVVGDYIMIDSFGRFLAARKCIPPLKLHTRLCHLSIMSCGLFFRRKMIDHLGLYFNPDLKDVSDAQWVLECLERNTKIHTLGQFTSVFTLTGANRYQQEQATREKILLASKLSSFVRRLKPLVKIHHRFRKLLGGAYNVPPFSYQIYMPKSQDSRQTFQIDNPSSIWRTP